MTFQLGAPGVATIIEANFFGIDTLAVQPVPASAFTTGGAGLLVDDFRFEIAGAAGSQIATPEPGTLALIASGGAALLARRRARRARRPVAGSRAASR
jgi:hypothetical protein